MPVYIGEKDEYLERAIESIFDQLVLPNEVLIVEDGPLNREKEKIIQKYLIDYNGTFRVIKMKRRIGLSKVLNIGIKESSYEYIARADSDDINCKIRFNEQIDFISKNPNIDVVGGSIAEFKGEETNIISIRKMPCSHNKIKKLSKLRCPMNHMTVIYKKESVLSVGGYKEEWKSLEDYDFWVRMLNSGFKFANINKILVKARIDNLISKRSGYNYLKNEIKFQKYLLRIGYINYFEFIRNIIIRIPFRLNNKNIVSLFYRYFARQNI